MIISLKNFCASAPRFGFISSRPASGPELLSFLFSPIPFGTAKVKGFSVSTKFILKQFPASTSCRRNPLRYPPSGPLFLPFSAVPPSRSGAKIELYTPPCKSCAPFSGPKTVNPCKPERYFYSGGGLMADGEWQVAINRKVVDL